MRVRLNRERLLAFLARSRLSQNHWAIKLGLSRGHWSEIVNGKHPHPSPKTRERMVEVLGLPFHELFEVVVDAPAEANVDFRRAIMDRYVIDQELAQGGMGAVYLARDARHGRVVAVKVVSPEAVSGIGVTPFLREISTVAKLQHPHILPLYDSGEAAGHPFYVMPYIRGGSLRTRLKAETRLLVEAVARLTAGVAAALEHAHVQRILHCDVKPENILLDGDHPYVMDFGIARKLHSEVLPWNRQRELDFTAGTPAYVSPEQASGETDLDARSDVYSLACVVYEMLAGRPPFEGTTTEAVVSRRFVSPPPPIRDFAPEVPPALESAVERAMALEPARRPATAVVFAATVSASEAKASSAWSRFSIAITRALNSWRRPGKRRGIRLRPAFVEGLATAVRQGARSLARTPAFSLSVILLLGVGIGSVSAIFAVVDHVLLRPLPYPHADRLVAIEGTHSIPALRDMQAMGSIEAWGAASTDNARLSDRRNPLLVRQAVVTDGFFQLFGARASMGRLLQPADSQFANTAVISYGTWVRVFGGDANVIGSTIRIDDAPVTVVGVVDPNFALPEAIVGTAVDVWRPLDPAAEYMTKRDYWMFQVAGRLGAAATITRAQQEAARVANERAKAFPQRYTEGGRVLGLAVRTLRDATTGTVEQPLRLLLGAVSLLLLVACVNVTHLVLARGVGRRREMAVRRALGARTRSLVAQLLIEVGILGAAGAVLGAVIANAGVRAFLALTPTGLPRAATIDVDARVLLFAGGVGMLTAIVFGLVPAVRLSRRGSSDSLRDSGRTLTGSRGAHRLRRALVVGEVAVSLVLVAQAGWLLRSFIRMSHADLGFRTSGIVEIPLSIPPARHANDDSAGASAAEWYRRVEAIRESLARIGGVQRVTFGLSMPLEWVGGTACCWSTRPSFAGKERPTRSSVTHPVSDEFFDVFAIGFLAGEGWPRGAAIGAPYPAVLSEQLANQVYGGATAALGATFALGQTEFRIVGVARNTRQYGVDQPYETAVYIPANAMPFAPDNVTMAALTQRTDDALPTDLRAAIWRVEPQLPVPTINTVAELARRDSAHRRFDALLFGTFSVVALVLVAGGLAGTLLYMVSLQRRGLGIRLALGATPRDLERGVLTSGVGLAAIGVIFGTIGAWLGGRLIESRLYGVDARDARTLGLAVSVLMLTALLSSWIPARRAAVTSPIESLRAE